MRQLDSGGGGAGAGDDLGAPHELLAFQDEEEELDRKSRDSAAGPERDLAELKSSLALGREHTSQRLFPDKLPESLEDGLKAPECASGMYKETVYSAFHLLMHYPRASGAGRAPPVSTPTGSTGKARTSASLTEQEQQMNKVHELTLQLQMMTNERNELRAILANYTNNAVNNRQNSEREELKMDHQKETSELEKFPKEISQDSSRSKELTKKTNSYRRHLRERTQMKEKVGMLREDNRKLRQEQIFLQKSCEETKRLCEEDLEKIYDLLTKQQQGHQRLEEQLQSLLKQKELVTQQKNLAVKLQHHFTESQTRFEYLQHEMKQTTAQEEIFLQIELLQQELMCQHILKEMTRLEESRDTLKELHSTLQDPGLL